MEPSDNLLEFPVVLLEKVLGAFLAPRRGRLLIVLVLELGLVVIVVVWFVIVDDG